MGQILANYHIYQYNRRVWDQKPLYAQLKANYQRLKIEDNLEYIALPDLSYALIHPVREWPFPVLAGPSCTKQFISKLR